ncbi:MULTISPECIES: hypothetical protein [unclassified Streptomyces]|uniref:hypothetical protein n=1 Tax=unclassified Streptomyces TaxID=2593676 RepID=UPI0033209E56
MTTTRKTPAASDVAVPAEPDRQTAETPTPEPERPTVVGPPLRPGQEPTKVVLAHHLRIGGTDFRPGESAVVSPDYARQLTRNGYVARG